jgi:dynactin-5
MDTPQHFFTSNEYKVIPQGNLKLSKKFFARGSNQIILNSMNVVEDDVILRGDLGKITIGNSTILDTACVLRPSLNSPIPPFNYMHLKIGSNCYVGKNTILCASGVGSNVFIGSDCIIAERCEIGTNVKILDNSYVPPDTKVPDNSIFGGNPAKYLGEIAESADIMMSEFCNNYYKNLIITQASVASSISKEEGK